MCKRSQWRVTSIPIGRHKPLIQQNIIDQSTQTLAKMSQNSEWEKTWAKVIKDPLDFSSWESLVKLAEGVKSLTSDQDKQNLRTVYDHFLGKFPLLFGYWKKYADWEALMAGPESAVAVYERGVTSIHNSVDLWVFYLSYTMEKAYKSPEVTRELFERGNSRNFLTFSCKCGWFRLFKSSILG